MFDGLIDALFAWDPTSLGALVIVGDRITQREAVLTMPKANDPPPPRKCGTRHRAALGICCRCDALALVVSEERGDITGFQNTSWHTIPFPTCDDDETWARMERDVCALIKDGITPARPNSP